MPEIILRLVREPLVHFLLIGALLFVVFDWRQGGENLAPDRIVIDREQIGLLAARFERTRLRPPTQAELESLIEEQVREEVYYREALALGLDRDDAIVRRRMRMKLEFVLDDLSSVEPGDDRLQEYLAKHAERYEVEARVSFLQVFLSANNHSDLEGDARRILQQLQQGAAADSVGDASLLPASFTLAGESVIERSFGADFSRALIELEPGDWSGPVYSPFGAHLVRIEEKIDPRAPALEEVRAQVLRDYQADERERQQEIAYRNLREKYEVIIEPDSQAAVAGDGLPAQANSAAQ